MAEMATIKFITINVLYSWHLLKMTCVINNKYSLYLGDYDYAAYVQLYVLVSREFEYIDITLYINFNIYHRE